jgi:hypothetical protein
MRASDDALAWSRLGDGRFRLVHHNPSDAEPSNAFCGPKPPFAQLRIPTARDATIAIVQRDIAASAIISSFALVVSGKVSAGEKAVAFVKARNR